MTLFASEQYIAGTVAAVGLAFILWKYFRFTQAELKGSSKKRYAFLEKEAGFEKYLMELVSCAIKIDRENTDSEFNYIHAALSKHFDPDKVTRMMKWLKKSLDLSIDYRQACKVVAYGFPLASKVQLLHLLLGIVTADGYLATREYELIKDMARQMRIPFRTFESVLAMFRFVREGEKKKRTYTKRRSGFRTSLSEAYIILGLSESASDKAVKRAYRKLAVLHHPDKVMHMGKDFQKAAKEKFQKIQEAYEVVKKSRGMN